MGAMEMFLIIAGVGGGIGLGVGIGGIAVVISYKIIEVILDWFDYHF